MATPITTGLTFPFDPTGKLASNLIQNEQQIITAVNWRDYHFIVPKLGPFFGDTLRITYRNAQGVPYPLVMGRDYYLSHNFADASAACAKPIYGSISFLDVRLAGVITISYQTIGGNWVLNDQQIALLLADKIHNPRTTTFEQIIEMPVRFPVIDHEWDLVDMVGMSEVNDTLKAIELEIRNKGEGGIAAHINNKANPHNVTKAQVGLDYLQNFPVATKVQAEIGTDNASYMTPLRVSEAIAGIVGGDFGRHVTDQSNPHKTTAAQVGAYSKTEMDTLLANKVSDNEEAYDSARFGGMTPIQYKAEVLTGTAANSIKFAGLTLSELKLEIQGGASADAERFGGLTPDEFKVFALDGDAANALKFAGMNKDQYKSWVLLGKAADAGMVGGYDKDRLKTWVLEGAAADANRFGGMTPEEFRLSAATGTAPNSLRFDGKTYNEAKVDFMEGTAYNSTRLGGLTLDQIKTEISGNTVYNAERVGGKSYDDIMIDVRASTVESALYFGGKDASEWVDDIDVKMDGKTSHVYYSAHTGESAGNRWYEIGNWVFAAYGPNSMQNDFIWLLAGGESGNALESGLYKIKGSVRNASGFKLTVSDYEGVSTGISFGYTIENEVGTANKVARIFARIPTNNCAFTVTEIGQSRAWLENINAEAGRTAEPAGIVYVTITGGGLVSKDSLNSTNSTLTSSITAISTDLNNYKTANNTRSTTIETNLSTINTLAASKVSQTEFDAFRLYVEDAFADMGVAFTQIETLINS